MSNKAGARDQAWYECVNGIGLPAFDTIHPLAWSQSMRKNVVMRDGMPIGHLTYEMSADGCPLRAEYKPLEQK